MLPPALNKTSISVSLRFPPSRKLTSLTQLQICKLTGVILSIMESCILQLVDSGDRGLKPSYMVSSCPPKGSFRHQLEGSQDLGSPSESLKNHQNASLLPEPSQIRKSVPKASKRLQNHT